MYNPEINYGLLDFLKIGGSDAIKSLVKSYEFIIDSDEPIVFIQFPVPYTTKPVVIPQVIINESSQITVPETKPNILDLGFIEIPNVQVNQPLLKPINPDRFKISYSDPFTISELNSDDYQISIEQNFLPNVCIDDLQFDRFDFDGLKNPIDRVNYNLHPKMANSMKEKCRRGAKAVLGNWKFDVPNGIGGILATIDLNWVRDMVINAFGDVAWLEGAVIGGILDFFKNLLFGDIERAINNKIDGINLALNNGIENIEKKLNAIIIDTIIPNINAIKNGLQDRINVATANVNARMQVLIENLNAKTVLITNNINHITQTLTEQLDTMGQTFTEKYNSSVESSVGILNSTIFNLQALYETIDQVNTNMAGIQNQFNTSFVEIANFTNSIETRVIKRIHESLFPSLRNITKDIPDSTPLTYPDKALPPDRKDDPITVEAEEPDPTQETVDVTVEKEIPALPSQPEEFIPRDVSLLDAQDITKDVVLIEGSRTVLTEEIVSDPQLLDDRIDIRTQEADLSEPVPPESIAIDVAAPSKVTGLLAIASATDSGKITLSWNKNLEIDVAYYKIYRNGVFLKTTVLPSYADTGLQPSTTYSYQVSAVDNSKNEGAKSNSVSATTVALTVTKTEPIDSGGLTEPEPIVSEPITINGGTKTITTDTDISSTFGNNRLDIRSTKGGNSFLNLRNIFNSIKKPQNNQRNNRRTSQSHYSHYSKKDILRRKKKYKMSFGTFTMNKKRKYGNRRNPRSMNYAESPDANRTDYQLRDFTLPRISTATVTEVTTEGFKIINTGKGTRIMYFVMGIAIQPQQE